MEYQDINAAAIDRWVEQGWEWGRPISHEVYAAALRGQWDVQLTPTKMVPHAWFGELRGKKVLGLASGGGQQMPIFAALGAECTVLDYSERQLASERLVAEREGYAIRIIRADKTKRLPFADETFDLIFHPVSNCYVREVKPIWKECWRIRRRRRRLPARRRKRSSTACPSIPWPMRISGSSWNGTTAACSFPIPWRSRSTVSWRPGSPCAACMRIPTARDASMR